jgi:hypothetical protein
MKRKGQADMPTFMGLNLVEILLLAALMVIILFIVSFIISSLVR